MKNWVIPFAIFLFLAATSNTLFSQIQVGSNINGEASGDQLGDAISLSSDGSRIAIGAPLNGGSGDKAGHVRVYDWIGGVWEQVGSCKAVFLRGAKSPSAILVEMRKVLDSNI